MDSPTVKQEHAIIPAKMARPFVAQMFLFLAGWRLCFIIRVISISPWQVAPCCVQSRADVLLMITVTDLSRPRFIINHSEVFKNTHKCPSKSRCDKQVVRCQKSTFQHMVSVQRPRLQSTHQTGTGSSHTPTYFVSKLQNQPLKRN